MSFDPFQLHPAMRVHQTDLSSGMQHNTSETGVNVGFSSYNTPNSGLLYQSTGSAQTHLPNVAAYLFQTRGMPPYIYEQNPGGTTSMDPFIDATKTVGPTSFGVLRIRNIPYEVLAKEIVHFLGRKANMIDPTMGYAVHIIMERPTSKTMDCFVEFQSLESVRDQISRYENMAQSGRLPKIGNRHVYVEESNQDELLAEMFPRAKSIIWKQADPVVIENQDPYSSGFNGFFTSEEMVGLVRHAEVPNRSPFSQNCLQRTYECMISTLYKFPWYAPELYTLADRNALFTTYMCQMKVLVDKVEMTDTKGLDENLLRDFIFAGMNCPGFGERKKHLLVTAAGYWGTAISMSSLSYFWPFDLISRKHGMVDDETVKSFLDLVELGVEAFPNGVPLKEHFIVHPSNFTTVRPENPLFLNNTRFEFNEESQRLDYGTAMGIEMKLMRELLAAAYASLKQQNYPFQEGAAANSYEQLAENLRMLNLQEQEILEGFNDNESTPRAQLTPAESPKGTPATVTNEGGHVTPTPTEKKGKEVDPTSKPFEPRRRLSEPQHDTDMIGGSPMHPGYHRRSSSTLSQPFSDNTPPTITPRKPTEYGTPTKSKRGGRVSVDHTIHEEDDEAMVMDDNPANQ